MVSIDPTPDFSSQAPLTTPLLSTAIIIDDEHTRAQLITRFCEMRCQIKVTSLECTGRAGLRAARESRPDLLLVCLNFRDISPAEFAQKIRAVAPKAKLIFIIDDCSEYLVHLMDAFDYHGLVCFRGTDLDDLVHIIAGIQGGIRFVSPNIAACQRRLRTAAEAFPKLLTRRQMNVLAHISRSLSDEEIAVQLKRSPGAILSCRKQIMRKLNIHTTPKLIRYGIEKGFDLGPLPPSTAVRAWLPGQMAHPIPIE
jgi:DNA-binding NarL/FixJ family response regulator